MAAFGVVLFPPLASPIYATYRRVGRPRVAPVPQVPPQASCSTAPERRPRVGARFEVVGRGRRPPRGAA
eukprot:8244176-Lingulodinium_polyedra.AAC.1